MKLPAADGPNQSLGCLIRKVIVRVKGSDVLQPGQPGAEYRLSHAYTWVWPADVTNSPAGRLLGTPMFHVNW